MTESKLHSPVIVGISSVWLFKRYFSPSEILFPFLSSQARKGQE